MRQGGDLYFISDEYGGLSFYGLRQSDEGGDADIYTNI